MPKRFGRARALYAAAQSAGEDVLDTALTWLAMDNATNTVTSGNFETVVDKTGNGRDLTQSTSSLRPSKLDSAGIISAEYDAIDDVLVGASADWDFTFLDEAGFTYALVFRADGTGEGGFGHWWDKATGTPDSRGWIDNESAGTNDMEFNLKGATDAQINTDNNRPVTQGNIQMVFLTYDGANPIADGIDIWVDGTSIGTAAVASGSPPP